MLLLKKILSLFKRPSSWQKIYHRPQSLPELLSLAAYPAKESLADQSVYACRLSFMVTLQDEIKVTRLISSVFDNAATPGEGLQQVTGNSESLHFSARHEFNGVVFEMITDSTRFLAALDQLALPPLPPWLAFPDLDPESMGSLQGSLDYWWHTLWLPFWQERSDEDKARYLAVCQAPAAWVEKLQPDQGFWY